MKTIETPVGPLLAWNDDDITRDLEKGHFWDEHLKASFDTTDPNGWAIDLGANIGFFTVYFAQRFEHVLAVEAHPETAAMLQHNVEKNGIAHKVTVVAKAAFDRYVRVEPATSKLHGWTERERSFADMDSLLHSAGLAFVEDPAQQHHLHELSVETVVVDDLIPKGVVVKLLKVDVQGAALRALYGCTKLIARDRPRIVFEFEHHVSTMRGDMWPDHVAFFNEREYDVFSIPGPWSDFLAVPR